jgi:predicted unusual protein kinase regulating ubiquinone biosynthesis (AarF/ABC1/UbiB family)
MFVKLMQSLAGIKNMPNDINAIIKQNTNHVYYSDDEIDHKLLLHITNKYNIKLDQLEPINSGMVAIVFSGVDKNNKRVIIKIKRKNIKSRIENGYKSLNRLYTITSYMVYPFRMFDEALLNIRSFIESKDYILTQCEFNSEINAMNSIRKTFSEYNKDIIIPVCYNDDDDREDTQFIIMEFIDGTTCFDVDDKYKKAACELLFMFTFTTSFFGEMYHSDLHPGNLLVITNGDRVKLGIIDYGMNIVATDEIKNFSHGCLNLLIEHEDDPTKMRDALKFCVNLTTPPLEIDKLTKDEYDRLNVCFYDLVQSVGGGELDEATMHRALKAVRETTKSDSIVLSTDMIKYAMGLSMIQSSARLLVHNDKEIATIMKKSLRVIMSY